jgi:hypothetical protein
MATQRGKGDKDLTPDELAPSAEEAAGGAIIVTGILGDSPNPDNVRLYLDVAFSRLYEIPREAIIRRTAVPAAQSPLGVDSSALLVRKGTVLSVQAIDSRTIEDEFLAGDFTAPGSFEPIAPVGIGKAIVRTRAPLCEPSEILCPSEFRNCPTGVLRCRTEHTICFNKVCQPGGGFTFAPCPTHTELNCPSSEICLTERPAFCPPR